MAANPKIATLSLVDVEMLRQQPNVQVIDIRPPFSYCGGRVAGSLNLPGAAIIAWRNQIPADRKLIFVDDDGSRAIETAEAAVASGYVDVSVMEGGFDAWQAAELPTETISDGMAPPPPVKV